MKWYRYKELHASGSNKKPYNTHLMIQVSSTIWYMVDSSNQRVLLKTINKGSSYTTVTTRTRKIQACFHDRSSNRIYLVDCDQNDTQLTAWYFIIGTDTPVSMGTYVDTSTYAYDIWKSGANFFITAMADNAGQKIHILKWVDPNWTIRDNNESFLDIGYMSEVVYAGGTYPTFIIEDSVDHVEIWVFDDSIPDFYHLADVGSNLNLPLWNMRAIAVMPNEDSFNFVLLDTTDSKYYMYHCDSGTVSKIGEHDVSLMLDRNISSGYREKAYHIVDYEIYELTNNKINLLMIDTPALNSNVAGITDDYLITGGSNPKVWEYTDQEKELIDDCNIDYKRGSPTLCSFIAYEELPNNEGVLFYDDNDVITFEGSIIEREYDEIDKWTYKCMGFDVELTENKLTVSASAENAKTLVQRVLDQCNYLTYTSTSITDPLINITMEFKNLNVRAILKTIADLCDYIFYVTPTGIVYFNDGANIPARIYPATYNFRDEAVGTSGTDIDFVDSATLYDGACEIVSDWQSHKKVLRLQDDATAGEDPSFYHLETQATAGTREFYIGTNDKTEDWRWSFYENGNAYIIRIRITNNNLYYLNSVGTSIFIQAVANDTLYHIKVVWRADNTHDIWVNGDLKVDNVATWNNQVSGIDRFYMQGIGDSTAYCYLDAYGDPDNDANYKIGDNCFWRHYKESEADTFEEDDVGTQGTSITWVDSTETATNPEIVVEFNEHKKVLRAWEAAASNDWVVHDFATASTTGFFSTWIKVTNATLGHLICLRENGTYNIYFQIDIDQFQIQTGGAWREVTNAPTPADNTYYFLYIQWYADNTFDLWIDNIKYENGTAFQNNFVGSGIDDVILLVLDGSTYMYLDAPISSLDGDKKGNNQILISDEPNHILGKPKIKDIAVQINYVKGFGTYDSSGVKISKVAENKQSQLKYGKNRYIDHFPHVDDETELQALVDAILARKGIANNPKYVYVTLYGLDFQQCGEMVNMGLFSLRLSAEDYYILTIKYNAKRNEGVFTLSSGIVMNWRGYGYAYGKTTEADEEQLDQLAKIAVFFPIGIKMDYFGTGIKGTIITRNYEISIANGDDFDMKGWYVANGQASTPNCIDKFVRNEATSGVVGGSDDAIVVSHSHSHTHTLERGNDAGTVRGVDIQDIYDSTTPIASSLVSTDATVSGVSGTDKNIPAKISAIPIIKMS